MMMPTHRATLSGAILALDALLAACAPALPVADVPALPPGAASTRESSYVDDLKPAATPDPVPLPTAAPGEHSDVIGMVTALSASAIDVDGVTYGLTAATEVKGSLTVGGKVKLEYVTNADGSRTVIEAKGAGFFDDSSDY